MVNLLGFLIIEPSLKTSLQKQPVQQRGAFFTDVVVVDSEAWTNEMQMGAATLAVVHWFCLWGQQKDYPLQSISFDPYGPKGLSFSCATAWDPRLSLLLSQLWLNAVLQILTI